MPLPAISPASKPLSYPCQYAHATARTTANETSTAAHAPATKSAILPPNPCPCAACTTPPAAACRPPCPRRSPRAKRPRRRRRQRRRRRRRSSPSPGIAPSEEPCCVDSHRRGEARESLQPVAADPDASVLQLQPVPASVRAARDRARHWVEHRHSPASRALPHVGDARRGPWREPRMHAVLAPTHRHRPIQGASRCSRRPSSSRL